MCHGGGWRISLRKYLFHNDGAFIWLELGDTRDRAAAWSVNKTPRRAPTCVPIIRLLEATKEAETNGKLRGVTWHRDRLIDEQDRRRLF